MRRPRLATTLTTQPPEGATPGTLRVPSGAMRRLDPVAQLTRVPRVVSLWLVAAAGLAVACTGAAAPADPAGASASAAAQAGPWSKDCTSLPSDAEPVPATQITILAEKGAAACGFTVLRLAVPANAPATVVFEDRDPVVPHNFALYRDQGYDDPIVVGTYILAPEADTIALPPLPAGAYHFVCDAHTRTMFGTLTAVEG